MAFDMLAERFPKMFAENKDPDSSPGEDPDLTSKTARESSV